MTDLLRRQYDEMVSENARLQALLAERDAEVARLVAAIQRHRPAERQPLRDVCDLCTNWWPCPTIQVLDAPLAARGGES